MIKINDTLYPSKDTTIKKTLLGVNVIETSVQAEVKIGDVLNDWYHVKQINSKKGDYTNVTAEHEIYKLINIVYQSPDNYFSQFSYANVRLEELIGADSLLQQLIPYNIVINSDVNLDAKRDIDFQDDNCLSALQKIAERFNIEFIPRINGTNMEIVIADIIGNTIPQVNVIDGINSANVSKSVDSKDVVTRVFPNGSTSGLPINYSYNNLKPNKFYAYANPDLLEYPFHGKFDDAAATFTGKIVVAEDSAIPETQLSLSGVAFNTNFTINTETTIITINGFPSDTNQLAKLKLLTADNKLIKDIYVSQINQKIFFNDIKWNASTPQFFIEDNTIPSHPIEKSITFSEIQPKLISGQINNFAPSVSGSWAITVTPELIANVDLSEVHKQKARVAFYDYSTMFSGDGFIIDSIDYTNGILYIYPPKEEETDKLRKNDSWLISTGDVSNKNFTFTLTDYIHVQQVNEACQAVLEQGEQYLIQHKNPQITYTIDRLKTNELNIGDTVRIVDGTRPLKIDSLTITGDDNIDLSFAIDGVEVSSLEVGQTIQKVLRITLTNNTSLLRSGFLEVKINGETFLTHNYSVNPNEYEKVYGYVGEIVRIMEYAYDGVEYTNLVLQNFNRFKAYAYNQKEATMADIYNAKDALKIDVQQAALKAKFQEEQWRLLIDSNFYGDYTLTEGIRIGSEDRNFLVSDLAFDADETADNFIWNKISWTTFDFSLAINPSVTASILTGSITGLSVGNYFIYVKIQEGTEEITPDIKIDPTSINNSIYLTTSKLNNTYDAGYYYFALGVVKLQTGLPKLYSLSYGMTYIDGGLVKAKTITADKIQAGAITADKIQAGAITADKLVKTLELVVDQKLTIPNIIDLGYKALSDSTAGLRINNGKFEIQGQSSKMLLSAQGIRQIYTLSMSDQIDANYSLAIPIYIPKNTDGTGVSSGTARIIVKAEKFRAYSNAISAGGSYSHTTTSSAGGSSTSTSSTEGGHMHGQSLGMTENGDHSHNITGSYTTTNGAHQHTPWAVMGVGGEHTHTISIANHTHSVNIGIPDHTHPINFGIYESTNTATITVSKGTSSWTVTTDNKLDVSNIDISDGEIINISADNLARVQAYIFVEYFLY
jgi:hypothetical protein